MNELVKKHALDGRVAELLGKRVRDVSHITEAFLHEVVRALVESGEVRLDGLGTLHVNCRRGVVPSLALLKGTATSSRVVPVERKYHVNFRRSIRLKEALRARFGKENIMDKFGVDEGTDNEKLEKAAADGCPQCGAKCTKHGSTMVCPKCGTEPFEKKG